MGQLQQIHSQQQKRFTMLKYCALLVVLAYVASVEAGSKKIGAICTRVTIWNNECEAVQEVNGKKLDVHCKTSICGASRCWPKNLDKPSGLNNFCYDCWWNPSNCHQYFSCYDSTIRCLPDELPNHDFSSELF